MNGLVIQLSSLFPAHLGVFQGRALLIPTLTSAAESGLAWVGPSRRQGLLAGTGKLGSFASYSHFPNQNPPPTTILLAPPHNSVLSPSSISFLTSCRPLVSAGILFFLLCAIERSNSGRHRAGLRLCYLSKQLIFYFGPLRSLTLIHNLGIHPHALFNAFFQWPQLESLLGRPTDISRGPLAVELFCMSGQSPPPAFFHSLNSPDRTFRTTTPFLILTRLDVVHGER